MSILNNIIKTAPTDPGIYRMLGKDQEILYIGKAKNIKQRLSQYSNFTSLPYRIKHMVSQIHNIELIRTDSEIEALILELNLIKTQKPKYNILLTDDKNFPYIHISSKHEYPGLYITRKLGSSDTYFGPYTGSFDVNQVVNLLRKSFN